MKKKMYIYNTNSCILSKPLLTLAQSHYLNFPNKANVYQFRPERYKIYFI